jgi:hypothetical protein
MSCSTVWEGAAALKNHFIADLHLLTQALNRDIERVRSKGEKTFVTSVSGIVALSK